MKKWTQICRQISDCFSSKIIDLNGKEKDGWTQLMTAFRNGNTDNANSLFTFSQLFIYFLSAVCLLLSGICLLFVSCLFRSKYGNIQISKYPKYGRSLQNIDLDGKDKDGLTQFMNVCRNGHKNTICFGFLVRIESGFFWSSDAI